MIAPAQPVDAKRRRGRPSLSPASPLLHTPPSHNQQRTSQWPSNSAISASRWFNGKFMPEAEVMIPFRDRSWKYGDGAFDMTRTFNGTPFRLKEHIDRFYRSLRYLQIDPGVSPKEMVANSEEVVARNEHLRAAVGDWWVGQRVSRGVDAVGDEGWEHTGPNVVIEMLPLPLAKRASSIATAPR